MRIKLSNGTWLALADDLDSELVAAHIANAEEQISAGQSDETVVEPAKRGRPRAI